MRGGCFSPDTRARRRVKAEARSMALSMPVNGVREEGDKEPLIELFVKVRWDRNSVRKTPRDWAGWVSPLLSLRSPQRALPPPCQPRGPARLLPLHEGSGFGAPSSLLPQGVPRSPQATLPLFADAAPSFAPCLSPPFRLRGGSAGVELLCKSRYGRGELGAGSFAFSPPGPFRNPVSQPLPTPLQ